MANSIALYFRNIPTFLSALDGQLLDFDPRGNLAGIRRFATEFLLPGRGVHLGKWSSWSLLVIMTFTIVANLKHIKARIHIPPP